MVTCSICGRPLTDKHSIKLGVGPICRINKKLEAMGKESLANRAEYTWEIIDDIICITDMNGLKSVTNDVENILEDFLQLDYLFLAKRIIYRDSMGIWDEISFNTEKAYISRFCDITFKPIGEKELNKAIKKIKQALPGTSIIGSIPELKQANQRAVVISELAEEVEIIEENKMCEHHYVPLTQYNQIGLFQCTLCNKKI